MLMLSTFDHEMYGSNPVSCCPELEGNTIIKDDKKNIQQQ
jgi:hypothetical protein